MLFKKPSVLVALFLSLTACNQNQSLIDHITFQPAANLETIRVSVVFAKSFQTNFAGIFNVGDYGNIFVNPFTTTENFEVGFSLNTAIVNDQNYIKLSPTDVLPSGVSTEIGYAVVEVKSPQPINKDFDIVAYVDVLKGAWLGAAMTFSSATANNLLPQGLTLTQGFLPDAQKQSQVIAALFGPIKDAEGIQTSNGGIAVFADIKKLLGNGTLSAGEALEVHTTEPFTSHLQYAL